MAEDKNILIDLDLRHSFAFLLMGNLNDRQDPYLRSELVLMNVGEKNEGVRVYLNERYLLNDVNRYLDVLNLSNVFDSVNDPLTDKVLESSNFIFCNSKGDIYETSLFDQRNNVVVPLYQCYFDILPDSLFKESRMEMEKFCDYPDLTGEEYKKYGISKRVLFKVVPSRYNTFFGSKEDKYLDWDLFLMTLEHFFVRYLFRYGYFGEELYLDYCNSINKLLLEVPTKTAQENHYDLSKDPRNILNELLVTSTQDFILNESKKFANHIYQIYMENLEKKVD